MELKQQVLNALSGMNDEQLFWEIQQLIKKHNAEDANVVPMTAAMKERVKKAEEESKAGLGIPHEQVMDELEEWLK